MGLMIFGKREKDIIIPEVAVPVEHGLSALVENPPQNDKYRIKDKVVLLVNVDASQTILGMLESENRKIAREYGTDQTIVKDIATWANRFTTERRSEPLTYDRYLQLVKTKEGRAVIHTVQRFLEQRPAAVIPHRYRNADQEVPYQVRTFSVNKPLRDNPKNKEVKNFNADWQISAIILDPHTHKRIYFVQGSAANITQAQRFGIKANSDLTIIASQGLKAYEVAKISLSDISLNFFNAFNECFEDFEVSITREHIEQAIDMLLKTPQAFRETSGSDPLVTSPELSLRTKVVELIKKVPAAAYPLIIGVLRLNISLAEFRAFTADPDNPFRWEHIANHLEEQGRSLDTKNLQHFVFIVRRLRDAQGELAQNQMKDALLAELSRLDVQDIESQTKLLENQQAIEEDTFYLDIRTEEVAGRKEELEKFKQEVLPGARQEMAQLNAAALHAGLAILKRQHIAGLRHNLSQLNEQVTAFSGIPTDNTPINIDSIPEDLLPDFLLLVEASNSTPVPEQSSDILNRDAFLTLLGLFRSRNLGVDNINVDEVLEELERLYTAQGNFNDINFNEVSDEIMHQIVFVMENRADLFGPAPASS